MKKTINDIGIAPKEREAVTEIKKNNEASLVSCVSLLD